MNKYLHLCLAVILNTYLSGCSFLAPKEQLISVNGIPADATVIFNGIPRTVPFSVTIPSNQDIRISVVKENYEPEKIIRCAKLSPTGILDAVGTWFFIVPVFGFLSPGAWVHDQTNFYYVLTRSEKTEKTAETTDDKK